MNGYEKFLYWEGFRHGTDWANSCSFTPEHLDRAIGIMILKGVSLFEPASKDQLANAMEEATK